MSVHNTTKSSKS